MDPKELQEILRKHHAWLQKETGGERVNLTDADLEGADLTSANLMRAILKGAISIGAKGI